MSAPAQRTQDSIYSNMTCELDEEVVKLLTEHPNELHAHHAAWDFSGNVWFDGEQWCEEVWRYHSLVEIRTAATPLELIESTNDEYGWK